MKDFSILVLRIVGGLVLFPFAAVVVFAMVAFAAAVCVLLAPLALFEFAFGETEEAAR